MDAAITEILKLGFAGAVIVVLFIALRSRDAQFHEVQEKRIGESQANTERFLTALNASTAQNQAHLQAIEKLTKAFEAMTDGFNELKEDFNQVMKEGGGHARGGRNR